MSSLLSLVIPVYNEADSLVPLVDEIDEALATYGTPYEIVFVDDGSSDRSFPVMKELAEARDDVCVVKLRRNFGKAAALSPASPPPAATSSSPWTATSRTTRPRSPALTAPLSEGYDLVSGWKQRRQDPLNKTLPSKLFNWATRKASGVPPRLQLRLQGLPARGARGQSRSTASSTATSRCWRAAAASWWGRSRSTICRGATAAASTAGTASTRDCST